MTMMTTTRDLLVLAICWGVAACGGLAAADIGDSESSTGAPGGSVEAVCTNRGSQCQWEITKCKAQPACAKWYGCVSSCDAKEPQKCFAECSATAPTNGSTILTCLQNACAQGGKEVGVGGEYNNAGGSGPNGDADAATDFADAGAGPTAPAVTWDGCRACLYDGQAAGANGVMISNCQAQCLDGCHAELAECQKQCGAAEPCLAACNEALYPCKEGCVTAGIYKHVLGITPEGDPNGCRFLPDWASFEKCLFDSKALAEVGEKAWEGYVSSGLHQCVMTQCKDVCLPEDTYQPCSTCLQNKCTDQANAYWQSPEALGYDWCMDHCPTCDCSVYGGGADILNQFVMCREQSCFAECSSH